MFDEDCTLNPDVYSDSVSRTEARALSELPVNYNLTCRISDAVIMDICNAISNNEHNPAFENGPDFESRPSSCPISKKERLEQNCLEKNGPPTEFSAQYSETDDNVPADGLVFTAIDLFAGIGGIRLGFQNAFDGNFKVDMVSEINHHAVKTYKANFTVPETVEGDITEIKSESIPDFDICMAGFPCQAFSYAGKRKGFEDRTRGTLFYDIVRICNDKQPMVIFCENVKGLISIDKGRTFNTILESFKEIGYTPYWDVLNSKYYDTPQNRERVYIVAFRKDIDSESFEFPSSTKANKTIKDILEEKPVDPSYFLSEQYFETLERHRKNHESKGHGFGYVIKKESDIANAVICGGMGRERNLLIDYDTELPEFNPRTKRPFNKRNIRVMTPREWAKLQ